MSHVEFAPNAADQLERLIREHQFDRVLLDLLDHHLNRVAESPTTHTEPAVSPPFRPDRLMANFRLVDPAERRWQFVVLLKRKSDEEGIVITMLSATQDRGFS